MAVPAVPYRGIQPFRYVDHAIFLAREEETEDLVDLVAIYRGVLLYGASGDGKSSLINAGLLPATARRRLHPERVRVQPRAGEEIVIERIATTEDDGGGRLPSLLAPDGDESSRIVVSVQAFEARVREACGMHRPLLIFDQFEEIITLFEDDDAVAVQRDIVKMLVRLLREPLAVKLLFVFREDYLSKVKHLLGAVPELVDQALRLEPLSADALPTIIRGPFERHPGHFTRELDPELAERVCAALEERFGSADLSLSEVETVALRLWESDDPRALLETRGVQGILEDYLGEALDAFSLELRAAAIALLAQMVTSAGTRNVISAEDLVQRVREEQPDLSPTLLSEALERLERESRLIRRERRRDIYLYEITSEFLLPWISQRHEEARLVQERRRDEVRREQERARERRRLRVLGSIAGTALVVAALVAILAVWALNQRTEAQRQRIAATSLALASSASPLLSSRPDVSLLLALEANRASPRVEARTSMLAALAAARVPGAPAILAGHTSSVDNVAFSPDGRTLASAGADATIRLWDVRNRKQVGAPLIGHTASVNDVAFSRDGRTLASAGADATIRLWDVRTHNQLGAMTNRVTDQFMGVAFSPDGRTLASANADKTIRLWDIRTHRAFELLRGADTFNDVAFSPDGRTLACAGFDGTIRLLGVRTGEQLRAPLKGHTDGVTSVTFSPDGRTVGSASIDKTIRLWSVRTGKQLGAPLKGHTDGVTSLAFSPDRRTLGSGSFDDTVRLWDVRTHKQLTAAVSGRTRAVYSVAFSRDEGALASATSDNAIRLWRVHTRKQIGAPLTGHTSSIYSVVFSPDGRTLASAGDDRTIRLWDARTHKQIGAPLTGHASPIYSLAFSPDGRTLGSASADKTIRLWDVRTQKQIGTPLTGHTSPIYSLAFNPDGRRVVSVSADRTIRLWDARTHKQIGTPLTGHASQIHSLAFSPDGRRVVSAGLDNSIRLWDVRARKQVKVTLTERTSGIYSLAFSRNGAMLASASPDNAIRLWTGLLWRNFAELQTEVCNLAGSGLSTTEWAQYATGIRYRQSCP